MVQSSPLFVIYFFFSYVGILPSAVVIRLTLACFEHAAMLSVGQSTPRTPQCSMMPSPCLTELRNRRQGGVGGGGGGDRQAMDNFQRDCKRNDLLFQTQIMCYGGTDRTDTNKTCQE